MAKDKKIVYIIHGWSDGPQGSWFPWLKTELETRGFEVCVPSMPDADEPKIEAWVGYLAKVSKMVDENTYFVGHSIGCQTILRYLERLLNNKKIGGAVFVAGWFFKLTNLETEEEEKIAEPWVETPINFEKVKKITRNFIAIFSDNDPFVPLDKNVKLFRDKLDAEIMIEHGKGHMIKEDGVTELPIVLEALLRMTQ